MTLARTRFQELQAIDSRAAGVSDAAPAGLASLTPKTVDQFRRKPREGPQRRMVDHRLPPYVECNFRSLHFMMVRYPKVSDFPRERWAPAPAAFLIHALSDAANPACPRPLPPTDTYMICLQFARRFHARSPTMRRLYQPESLDLLYRHYYKNFKFG